MPCLPKRLIRWSGANTVFIAGSRFFSEQNRNSRGSGTINSGTSRLQKLICHKFNRRPKDTILKYHRIHFEFSHSLPSALLLFRALIVQLHIVQSIYSFMRIELDQMELIETTGGFGAELTFKLERISLLMSWGCVFMRISLNRRSVVYIE